MAEQQLGSSTESAPTDTPMVAVSDQPLSVDQALRAVSRPAAGGIALFVGTVRDHDSARGVRELAYEAHPSALEAMLAVVARVAERDGVLGLAAVHRVGTLSVGDLAVVVAASAAHRAQAFAAARDLIEGIKATVPIWKRQLFDDGSVEWVGIESDVDGAPAATGPAAATTLDVGWVGEPPPAGGWVREDHR